MSPDGFTVDLDALGAARDQVGRLAEELTGALPHDVPSVEAFGHDQLAGAINKFAAREQHAPGQLASDAESFRVGLAETIKTYQKLDDDGADRFGGIAS